MIRTQKDQEDTARVIEFINAHDHCFLNLSMPSGKAMLLPAEGIEGSTILTAMARNGTDFGIRMAGMPQRWVTAPAGIVEGLYLPGFSAQDANPDIGDSTITETAGIGGFAMATAPAIVTFISGTPRDAINTTLDMYEITFAENKNFTIPFLDFRGTPTGIDIRKVVEKNMPPRVNTGVAHKDPGVGQVGAGVAIAPMSIFEDALVAFAEKYGF